MILDSLSSNLVISPQSYNETPIQDYNSTALAKELYHVTLRYKKSIPYQRGVLNNSSIDSWILFLLLFSLGSLAFVRGIYRKRFSMLFQTFINWKLSKQIIRYEKVYTHPVNLLLLLNFIICVPLFFAIASLKEYNLHIPSFRLFISILIPLILYLLAKFFSYQFSAWLLKEKEAIDEYVFQTNLFNKYVGVLFLILSILLIYSPISSTILFNIGLLTLLFFLVFQLIRGVIIGIQRAKSLHLIILYLCTLEILPWLVLGKWLNNLQ